MLLLIASLPATATARQLSIVLPLRADLTGLQRYALAVTTPGSPAYAQYAPMPELARRFGASTRVRRAVVGFLERNGAAGVAIDPTGLFADATLEVQAAERLFGTALRAHRASDGSEYVTPGRRARIPAPLVGLATGVVGLDTQPVRADAQSSQQSSALPHSGTASGCPSALATGAFTPNQYLTAYGFDALHRDHVLGQGERVAVIELSGFKFSDILTFASCFHLRLPHIHGFGVGFRRPLPPGGEAPLDIEILAAAAPRLKSIDVYEARTTAADVLRALTAPLVAPHRPDVISASLGLCEPVLSELVGRAGLQSTEGALEMAAASGITVLAASGDRGSADCAGARGQTVPLRAVNYPASSWWVTGVGGTNLSLSAQNQIDSEIVWNDGGVQPGAAGGGGMSAVFRRPNYQDGIVSDPARAVPDVSMLADILPGYAIYCSARRDCINSKHNHPWLRVGGTSASTPLLAAGMALADQQLRARRRQNLGLVNPLLYRIARSSGYASVFHDVTQGSNDVGPELTGHPLGCCTAGPGYDEASGLGSVDVSALSALADAAQPPIVNVGLSLPRQRPLSSRRIRARVSCSGRCLFAAVALVKIGGTRAFGASSAVGVMRARGARTVTLKLSRAQARKLRAAVRRHRPVTITVRGVLFDPIVSGVLFVPSLSVQRVSGPKRLRLA